MLITRKERQEASDPITRIYEDLEAELMANIVRHIRDYGRPVDSDQWRLEKLGELGGLNRENIRIIAESVGASQAEAYAACLRAAEASLTRTEPLFSDGKDESESGMSTGVREAVRKVYEQVWSSLNASDTVMLNTAADSYRRLVEDVCARAGKIAEEKTFKEILGEQAAAEAIGAASRSQALKGALKQFNERGIAGFVDKNGREWTPEAYAAMVLRTAASNSAAEAMFTRMDERGYSLIQVSSHAGARPKCARDQGKIFDRKNRKGRTTDGEGNRITYYPLSSSSYGEPDGLFGINCGHHGIPFIPGVSRKRYEPPEDLKENDEEYKKLQTQRGMEREVRKQKRLCMLCREAGDEEALGDARASLRKKEQKLHDYLEQNRELSRKPEREQIWGWDRSGAEAAQAAGKPEVEEKGGSGYTGGVK